MALANGMTAHEYIHFLFELSFYDTLERYNMAALETAADDDVPTVEPIMRAEGIYVHDQALRSGNVPIDDTGIASLVRYYGNVGAGLTEEALNAFESQYGTRDVAIYPFIGHEASRNSDFDDYVRAHANDAAVTAFEQSHGTQREMLRSVISSFVQNGFTQMGHGSFPLSEQAVTEQFDEMEGMLQGGMTGGRARVWPVSPYDAWFRDYTGPQRERRGLLLAFETQRPDGPTAPETLAGISSAGVSNLDAFVHRPPRCVVLGRNEDGEHAIVREDVDDGKQAVVVSNVLRNVTDALGASRVTRHMNGDERRLFEDRLRDISRRNDLTTDDVASYQRAFKRVEHVMEWLERQGITYEIVPERRFGQVSLKTDGPASVSVRMLDTPQNTRYIGGRVYSSGCWFDMDTPDDSVKARHRAYEYDPEDSVAVIRYAMGESVAFDQEDGVVWGVAGVDENGRNRASYNANAGRNETTTKLGRFTARVGAKASDGRERNIYVEHVRSDPNPWQNVGTMLEVFSSDGVSQDAELSARVRESIAGNVGTSFEGSPSVMLDFSASDRARAWLLDTTFVARNNMRSEINLEGMFRALDEFEADPESGVEPQWSDYDDIQAVQRECWEVLTGRSDRLMRPAAMAEELADDEEESETPVDDRYITVTAGDRQAVADYVTLTIDEGVGTVRPDGSGKTVNVQGVSKWMESSTSALSTRDLVINAVREAEIPIESLRGDDSANRRARDMLIRFDPETARPMASIDSDFARRMHAAIADTLQTSGLMLSGDIEIDDRGIVRYEGDVAVRMQNKGDEGDHTHVVGYIGQVFIPDEDGVIHTRYVGSENYAHVPGYRAQMVPPLWADVAGRPPEERMRLMGYASDMEARLRQSLRADMMTVADSARREAAINGATRLNSVYRDMYDERLDLDYKESALELCAAWDGYKNMSREELEAAGLGALADGVPEGYTPEDALELVDLKVATLKGRVTLGDSVRKDATTFASFSHKQDLASGVIRDRSTRDPFFVSGYRDMSVIESTSAGIFDLRMTSSGQTQGISRYLVEGVEPDADGFVHRRTRSEVVDGVEVQVADDHARAPIMGHEIMEYSENSPADRSQMSGSNIMHSYGLTPEIGLVLMPMNGLGQDDAPIVFKDTAASILVRGRDGGVRPFVTGDKICDSGGNKGVGGIIVDREMDLDEAERLGGKPLRRAVEFGRDNPDVGIVMPPFSPASRYNGTSFLMARGKTSDLHVRDESGNLVDVPGAVGHTRFIVTDKAADIKTSIYDDEAFKNGRGRKASGQGVWSIMSAFMRDFGHRGDPLEFGGNPIDMANYEQVFGKNAFYEGSHIINELFGPNVAAQRKVDEMLLVLGIDVDDSANMQLGISEQNANRRVIVPASVDGDVVMDDGTVRRDKTCMVSRNNVAFVDTRAVEQAFGSVLGHQGGTLALPFPLQMHADLNELARSGGNDEADVKRISTMPLTEDGSAIETDSGALEALGYTRHVSPVSGEASGAWVPPEGGVSGRMYGLPVMSASVRSGTVTDDGIAMHDFTRDYAKIAAKGVEYTHAERMIAEAGKVDEYKRAFGEALGGLDSFTKKKTGEFDFRSFDKWYNANKANMSPERRESLTRCRVDFERSFRAAENVERYRGIMDSAKSAAQAALDDISSRVVSSLNSKYNPFKHGIMTRRVSNSATSVASPDPSLPLNRIKMGRDTAEKIGISTGDSVLLWRDPQLRDAGMMYIEVEVSDDITGISMNPSLAPRADGDFDGDTWAEVKLTTDEAKREAEATFAIHNHLVDFDTVVDPHADRDDLVHPLIFQGGLDVKLACFFNEDLADRRSELEREASDTYRAFRSGEITFDAFDTRNRGTMDKLNELYAEIYDQPLTRGILRFRSEEVGVDEADQLRLDTQAHLDSVVDACVRTGAKGNIDKVMMYARNIGAVCDVEGEGADAHIVVKEVKDHSLFTQEEHEGVQRAQADKSNGTGVAGRFSQRGVMALRDSCMSSVLAMTYPVTQSLLQAKHDPVDGDRRYAMLFGCVKDLWQGKLVGWDSSAGEWVTAKDDPDNPVTVEQWIESAKNLYYSKEGLGIDVNPECIEEVGYNLGNRTALAEQVVSQTYDDVMEASEGRLSEGNAARFVREAVLDSCSAKFDDASADVAFEHVRAEHLDEARKCVDALRDGRTLAHDEDGWHVGEAAKDVSEWVESFEAFCGRDGLGAMSDSDFVVREGAVLHSVVSGESPSDENAVVKQVSDLVAEARVVSDDARASLREGAIASTYDPGAGSSSVLDRLAYAEKMQDNTATQMAVRAATDCRNMFDGSPLATDDIPALRIPRLAEMLACDAVKYNRVLDETGVPTKVANSLRHEDKMSDLMRRGFGLDSAVGVLSFERQKVNAPDVMRGESIAETMYGRVSSDAERRSLERGSSARYSRMVAEESDRRFPHSAPVAVGSHSDKVYV